MRSAPVAGAAVLFTSLWAPPAAADPVPLPQALQAVSQSCADARAALIDQGGLVASGSSRLVLATDRFEVTGPVGRRVVVAGVGTYGSIADEALRAKQRKAALRYLKRSGATWWFHSGAYAVPGQEWSAAYDQSRAAAVTIDGTCAQSLTGALEPVAHDANTWTFTMAGQASITITTDAHGRLVSWGDLQIVHGAQSVGAPAEGIAYGRWQRAAQAATLNATLRDLTRELARQVNAAGPSVAAIDAAARAGVPQDRAVPLRVRQLRKGILVYARNPYTKTYHAWRVYLNKQQARARRVAG